MSKLVVLIMYFLAVSASGFILVFFGKDGKEAFSGGFTLIWGAMGYASALYLSDKWWK